MHDWQFIELLEKLAKKWKADILYGNGTVEDCAEALEILAAQYRVEWRYPKVEDENAG